MNDKNWIHRLARHGVVVFGAAGWCAIGLGFIGELAIGDQTSAAAQSLLVLVLTSFFVTVLLRLLCAFITQPKRRRAIAVLLIAVLMWAAGSAVLNASQAPDITHFPAPGEWFFLISYIGMAGYLIIDARSRMSTTVGTWLEALVICGGTACLAGSLLLTPVHTAFGEDGLPLLVALLYPLIDLALALLVIAQISLRVRHDLRSSVPLVIGFMLFAIADLSFVTNLHRGTYEFPLINDALWGGGFALIAGSACRPSNKVARAVPRRQGPFIMIAASCAAIVVLAIRPGGGVGAYLAVPALVTLLAAGGRLGLALREANGAAEAFALSRTDDLTMLPNRRAVLSRLDAGLASSAPLALMMLDLDGFKEINDTLGHSAGDAVLEISAHRMREAMKPGVLVARLGGDEFALVVDSTDEIELLETARVVIDVVGQPLSIDGIELTTNASIGITTRSPGDATSTDLLRRADVAMYQAKQNRSGALLYDAHRDDFSRRKLQLAEDLRRGITDGQLVLWYQPQVDAASQTLCGVEALLRWQHPTQGLLMPAEFLPAARRAGLMLQISEAVGRMAVRDLRNWLRLGLSVRVAINCAPPELLSGMFLPRLFEAVREYDLPHDSLVIEVTEDSFLADPERARTILREIRQNHLQIAIDDYGTGFSSLSYLRDLPVQELKMDRSFIAAMRTDPRSRMIVASTFQMAQALGLRMVAEGVEDAATTADLVAMGVDVLQGYHVARPMPAAEIEGWVKRWKNLNAHFGTEEVNDPANGSGA